MNTKVKLTPELRATILAALRAGAFIQDAFRLAGVPDHVWRPWLAASQRRGPIFQFLTDIKQAQAQAKFLATQAVKIDSPDKWLANGPGRDLPDEPGWAAMSPPNIPPPSGEIDPSTIPTFARFLHNIRLVLAAFPEAAAMFQNLNTSSPPLAITSLPQTENNSSP